MSYMMPVNRTYLFCRLVRTQSTWQYIGIILVLLYQKNLFLQTFFDIFFSFVNFIIQYPSISFRIHHLYCIPIVLFAGVLDYFCNLIGAIPPIKKPIINHFPPKCMEFILGILNLFIFFSFLLTGKLKVFDLVPFILYHMRLGSKGHSPTSSQAHVDSDLLTFVSY